MVIRMEESRIERMDRMRDPVMDNGKTVVCKRKSHVIGHDIVGLRQSGVIEKENMEKTSV